MDVLTLSMDSVGMAQSADYLISANPTKAMPTVQAVANCSSTDWPARADSGFLSPDDLRTLPMARHAVGTAMIAEAKTIYGLKRRFRAPKGLALPAFRSNQPSPAL